MQQLPSGDPYDRGYRRLRFVRYADDFLLGVIGPKAEAEQIKASLKIFLRETLKLELSKDKTLITHATSQAPSSSAMNSHTRKPTTNSTLTGRAVSMAASDYGFPQRSSNNIAKPTWSMANRHDEAY